MYNYVVNRFILEMDTGGSERFNITSKQAGSKSSFCLQAHGLHWPGLHSLTTAGAHAAPSMPLPSSSWPTWPALFRDLKTQRVSTFCTSSTHVGASIERRLLRCLWEKSILSHRTGIFGVKIPRNRARKIFSGLLILFPLLTDLIADSQFRHLLKENKYFPYPVYS